MNRHHADRRTAAGPVLPWRRFLQGSASMAATNRLIARPFVGIEWAAGSIPSDGIKAGATSSEWGLNVRYEITRAVAPHVAVGRRWQRGADGGSGVNWVRAGLRLVL